MRAGNFTTAWQISDAALAARNPATRDDPTRPYHERWLWNGTSPHGRHVLVRCYHGLGDTIQFARFLPALRARAARVSLEAQPELLEVLGQIRGIDQLHAFDPAHPLPPSACDIEIMELGHVLRADAQTIGAAVPYLHARKPENPGPHLALCWQAGEWDPGRSIPLPTLLGALHPQNRFISLQRGPHAAEATAPHFINPADRSTNIARTAALIRASRHVITVDTMVAHLTGALAHPGTILLKPNPDWRWAEQSGHSLWYPTLKIASPIEKKQRQGPLF